ncbi:FADL011Wp [Eremothecium gossypii FDAG1]|nr:FADL011Wp [Eremothecium gossypii FDAG1]
MMSRSDTSYSARERVTRSVTLSVAVCKRRWAEITPSARRVPVWTSLCLFFGIIFGFIFSSLFWYIRERIRYVSHPTYSTGSPLPQRTGSADGTQDLAQKLVGTVKDECWSREVVKQEHAYVPLGKQGPIKRRWFPSSRLSTLSPFITWS